MVLVVVMMTASVVMRLDTVEKGRPLGVDVKMGLMAAVVLRFDLAT